MLLTGPRSHTSPFTSYIWSFFARATVPTWFQDYQLQRSFMFILQGTWSGPCCWASRIQLRLVGFINIRQRLLRFHKNARLHVAGYNNYSSKSPPTSWVHQQPSATTRLCEECTATCWRLLQLLVSPTSYSELTLLGDTPMTTLITSPIYETSRNQLRLVSFIGSSRSRGTWTIPGLGAGTIDY
jgi:hypothetical protein